MKRNFLAMNAAKITDGSLLASRHRPSNCHSLMARSFRLHARLCRLCGGFLIVGLYGRKRCSPPRVVWRSWYSLYSCACLAYCLWINVKPLVQNERVAGREPEVRTQGFDLIATYMRLTARVVYGASSLSGIISMLLHATKLTEFYKRASEFEKIIGVPHCECCTPIRFFWSDVRQAFFCFIYIFLFALVALSAVLQHTPSSKNTDVGKLVFSILWTMVSYLFLFVYRSVHCESLKSASKVLKLYLDVQLRALKRCVNVRLSSSVSSHEAFRRVENIRLNLCTIQKLKEDVNYIWQWPLIISTVGLLITSCSFLNMCFTSAAWNVRLVFILHAGYSAYQCVTLACSSQSLVNTTKKLKDTCESLPSVEENFRLQLQHLHASADPEAMSLEGGDFFRISPSLLLSVAAAMITYGVILLQTSHSLSTSGSKTVHG